MCLILLSAYNSYTYVSVQTYIDSYVCQCYDVCIYVIYVCMHVRMRVCNLRRHIPEGRLSGRGAHQHVQQTALPRWTNCPASKITELKAARYLCVVRAEHFSWKRQNDKLLRF